MSQLEEGGVDAAKIMVETFLIVLELTMLSLSIIVWRQLCNFIYTYWWKPRTIMED